MRESSKRVLQDHLPDLSRAIGKSFSEKDVSLYPKDPVGHGLGTAEPWLCASLTLSAAEEVYFDLGLYWDYEKGDEFTLVAMGTLDILEKDLFARASERFEGKPELGLKTFPGKKWHFSLLDPVPKDDPLSFQKKLHGLALRWVSTWVKVGGLVGLLPELSKPKRRKRVGAHREEP